MKLHKATLDNLQEQGYDDLQDYLQCLSEDYGVEYNSVLIVADLLGEDELFDGLVSAIENACEYC